jgi:hypothetical protein
MTGGGGGSEHQDGLESVKKTHQAAQVGMDAIQAGCRFGERYFAERGSAEFGKRLPGPFSTASRHQPARF